MPGKASRCALMILSLVAVSGSAAADSKVGVASATKNEVQGIRGAEKRSLETGSEIFLNEAIQTGDQSVAQLVFLDNTNLSVGPGSLVQLDKFVYDPNRGTREVIFEVGRGAFRFATGSRGAKNYNLKTHVATLGVRGTTFELVSTDGEVKVKLNQGLIQVRTNVGQIVWLTRPETLLIVYANGTVFGPVVHKDPIIQFARLGADPSRATTTSTSTGDGIPDVGFPPPSTPRLPSNEETTEASALVPNGQTQPLPFGFPLNSPPSTDMAPISPTR